MTNQFDADVLIETRIVQVPDVGPMFRRVHRTAAGEELAVEYMAVVYGLYLPVAETVADADPAYNREPV